MIISVPKIATMKRNCSLALNWHIFPVLIFFCFDIFPVLMWIDSKTDVANSFVTKLIWTKKQWNTDTERKALVVFLLFFLNCFLHFLFYSFFFFCDVKFINFLRQDNVCGCPLKKWTYFENWHNLFFIIDRFELSIQFNYCERAPSLSK